jgi:hypothetical protein
MADSDCRDRLIRRSRILPSPSWYSGPMLDGPRPRGQATGPWVASALVIGAALAVCTRATAQTAPSPTPAPGAEAPAPGAAPAPMQVYVVPAPQTYPPPGYYPPGYAPPGYAPPGYPPPGYYPPGYPPPGYLPQRGAKPPRMNPDDPPPGYHTESQSRGGLVVGGAVMLGVSYLLSALVASATVASHDSGDEPLFIPIVGPFITLSTSHVFVGTNEPLLETGRVFGGIGLIFDGLLQVAGASLLLVGLAVPKDVVVRDPPPGVPDVSFGPRGATARWAF